MLITIAVIKIKKTVDSINRNINATFYMLLSIHYTQYQGLMKC